MTGRQSWSSLQVLRYQPDFAGIEASHAVAQPAVFTISDRIRGNDLLNCQTTAHEHYQYFRYVCRPAPYTCGAV